MSPGSEAMSAESSGPPPRLLLQLVLVSASSCLLFPGSFRCPHSTLYTLYIPGTWRQVAARPHTPAPHHATTPWESYLDWTHILVWIPETKPYFYTYLLTLT